jgi:hypothetical protein
MATITEKLSPFLSKYMGEWGGGIDGAGSWGVGKLSNDGGQL